MRKVVITGVGIKSCIGNDYAEVLANLQNAQSGIVFNEKYSDFESSGVRVFGLSKDTLASHSSFSKKLDLQFPLISDPQTQLIKSLNAWKEKSMYGKKYMGAERSTFLIDKKLIIKYIWRKVKVEGHVEEVFDKFKELNRAL